MAIIIIGSGLAFAVGACSISSFFHEFPYEDGNPVGLREPVLFGIYEFGLSPNWTVTKDLIADPTFVIKEGDEIGAMLSPSEYQVTYAGVTVINRSRMRWYRIRPATAWKAEMLYLVGWNVPGNPHVREWLGLRSSGFAGTFVADDIPAISRLRWEEEVEVKSTTDDCSCGCLPAEIVYNSRMIGQFIRIWIEPADRPHDPNSVPTWLYRLNDQGFLPRRSDGLAHTYLDGDLFIEIHDDYAEVQPGKHRVILQLTDAEGRAGEIRTFTVDLWRLRTRLRLRRLEQRIGTWISDWR